ncbi:hypothetical protein AGABI2DRAFT_191394 [Agaricus bisporus var. bisporus H97]|uniref:hypothetical protein n=1 Tax=Agaricus bisporus var. bisporus (strain H97 / ATCC MYA-4626 / FGSC 10389) TaxID=936046 RepID=UPI00029F798D|nr:hypothetical protein AGABI2DRAFT_191394 [Agaricus bisporus var. bisporus H97]EKV49331.1 hypothetical protein AGABI2DRAFT_191394 [Agaricus bisporus var. bisporus H97]
MHSTKPKEAVHKQSARSYLVFLTAVATAFALYGLSSSLTEYTVCSSSSRIYTVSELQPQAQCITIKNERIIHLGKHDDIVSSTVNVPLLNWKIPFRWPPVSYVDPTDIIVPGLADAHAHVLENGWMMQLPLGGSKSVQEIVERVKSYIHDHPDVLHDPDRWIEGMGWDQTRWQNEEFPKAADLDQDPLLKGRPIVLSRVDGHARWVSPRVLEIMGTLPEDSEIVGGQIIRDSQGHPTGIFVDNAMDLIPIPPWTHNQMEEYFSATANLALQYGLTSIHDAQTKIPMVEFFQKKADEGAIPLRLYLMGSVALHGNNSDSDAAETAAYIDSDWKHGIPRFVNYGRQGRLTLRSVKLFADGALGSWGAAMLAPYSDHPDLQGTLLQAPEVLRAAVRRFWEDDMQVNVHCIGDKANRITLDIFEELIREQDINVSSWRPRIEHAQIIDRHDLHRFGKLGVIASVQPTHATSDMWYAESRLGPDRMEGAYAYATLLRVSGDKILPLGSDFPVEGVNPLLGFYAAVKRLAVDGSSPHGPSGWFPNERLTRREALKGMTLDPAYASFQEQDIGSLEIGKKADFVVFDRDFVDCGNEEEASCNGSEILEAKVKTVVIDGRVVRGALPQPKDNVTFWGIISKLGAYVRATGLL